MKTRALFLIVIINMLVANVFADWTGTWACSIYSDTRNLTADIENKTLRQIVRVSIPGDKIRLKFSNLFGESPLVMHKVQLSKSTGGHSIDIDTIKKITFDGSESISIPAGEEVLSDEIEYKLPALANMAISIYFGTAAHTKSGHVGSRTNTYFCSGDAVASSNLNSASTQTRWYAIAGIDVYDQSGKSQAVAAFGDSITDGYGTTTDAQNRWTDHLASLLHNNSDTANIGMLNQGIGATLVSSSGVKRFDRDILAQTNVRYLIVLYGVNDILFGNKTSSQIIDAYKSIIQKSHSKNILAYGGTIMPFGSCQQYTAKRELVRQEVNEWIRTVRADRGGFDAVVDFDIAMSDPEDSMKLADSFSLDGLHPNPKGYQKMAEVVNLNLFTLPKAKKSGTLEN